MGDFLSANLEALRKRFPADARRLESCDASAFEPVPVADGPWDLRIGTALLYEGRPQTIATQSLADTQFAYPKLVVCYGVGLGYHIRTLFSTYLTNTEHVLLVERSLPIFRRALELFDWRPIIEDERVSLLIGVEDGQPTKDYFVDYCRNYNRLLVVWTVTNVFDHAMVRRDGDYYSRVAVRMRQTIDEVMQPLIGSSEDGYRGLLNIVNNLPVSAEVPSFAALEGKFTGSPGIAVSTGPSLEKSISWLREVQNRAVICCSDSALRILLKHGITPHLVGCVERVPETRLLIEGIPHHPHTWWVTTPLIWPDTYQHLPGPVMHLMRPIGQLRWFYPEEAAVDTGQSVSHLLLIMLQRMGCSPIMLVGQDLAFDRHSARTHAGGVPDLLYKLGQSQRRVSQEQVDRGVPGQCLVEGNDGTPILTMEAYDSFRRAFSALIRKGETPVYNIIPADYGAKIPHAVWMDPREAPALLQATSPMCASVSEIMQHTSRRSRDAFLRQARHRLQEAVELLDVYRSASLDVLDSISIFRQRHSPVYYGRETFRGFFHGLEQAANNLVEYNRIFYVSFFLTFVQANHFVIAQRAEELLAREDSETRQIESQVGAVREWFELVYHWSSRAHRLLQRKLSEPPWA